MILSYILPNFFNFGLNMPVLTNPGKDYFYLGVPALLGLPFLILRRRFRDLAPSLAILAATLMVAINPYDMVWNGIQHSTLLPDIVRAWYFLAGVTLAFAPLTAYALDDFLARKAKRASWLTPVSVALMAVWAVYELYRWKSKLRGRMAQRDLLAGHAGDLRGRDVCVPRGAGAQEDVDGGRADAVCRHRLQGVRDQQTIRRRSGEAHRYSSTSFPGMMPMCISSFAPIHDYRIVVDADTGPLPNDFRHIGLITPQGFDPLLTTPFRKMVETYGQFRTDRIFEVDPENYDALRLFGVRYVISSEYSQLFSKLKDNPHYRLLGSMPTFYRVYEYLDAQPPFSWEGGAVTELERREWEPESRTFRVRAASGGKLALHEQFFPAGRRQSMERVRRSSHGRARSRRSRCRRASNRGVSVSVAAAGLGGGISLVA